MIVFISAFPRSGNTYLSHVLTSDLNKFKYIKIPKQFHTFQELDHFIANTSSDEAYVLGHNHLRGGWESKISKTYNLPIIFIVRHPLDCISSYLVLQNSKSNIRPSNIMIIIKSILKYIGISLTAFIHRIKYSGHIVYFDNLTDNINNELEHINMFLSSNIRHTSEITSQYMNSDFQRRADNKPLTKHDTLGNRIYLSRIQSLLISIFCIPIYKCLRLL